MPVNCKVSYIPFEARIDRTSFEVILRETKPNNLVMINCSARQVEKVHAFLGSQGIHTRVHYDGRELAFTTDSAVKLVYLDDNLYKTLPVQQISKTTYEVSRVSAALCSVTCKSSQLILLVPEDQGIKLETLTML